MGREDMCLLRILGGQNAKMALEVRKASVTCKHESNAEVSRQVRSEVLGVKGLSKLHVESRN